MESSCEEILSSYSRLTVSSRTETLVSIRDSVSKIGLAMGEDDEEVFEDASSDISILTRRNETLNLDRSKMRKALHQDLCLDMQKVFEPLFLRKCEPQKVRQGTAPPAVFPMLKVEMMEASKKLSGHSALLVSLDTSTYCVRYLAANCLHKSKNILVYTSPIYFVRFVARPEPQETNQSKFEDVSEDVHLMMSPDVAFVAKKMLPKWQTVTFTLAFGKHVAVKYRIIETRKQPIVYVKAVKDRVKRVPTSTLYRTEPVQRIEHWYSLKAHELKLSTVEKNDPHIVKRVFLEQQMTSDIQSVSSIVGDVEKIQKTKKKGKQSVGTDELNLMWKPAAF